jgi:hypothetical protein
MRKLPSCLILFLALLPAAVARGQATAPAPARPATSAAPRGLCAPVSLFSDDFSRYPPGWLSKPVGTLNGAIQEYHYLPHRGVPTQPWANAICHLDPWVAGDEDGVPYLEQHSIADLPDFTVPMFITGDHEWADYTVEAKMKPLSPLHFAHPPRRRPHRRPRPWCGHGSYGLDTPGPVSGVPRLERAGRRSARPRPVLCLARLAIDRRDRRLAGRADRRIR